MSRGRPRSFDLDEVLERATQLFWRDGYEATSLDDIAAETGVARPSLAAAFGNKEAIYIKSMERFSARMKNIFDEAFAASVPLPKALRRFYLAALDVYLSGVEGPRGCLVFCTASAVAARHPAVRAAVAALADESDKAFVEIFRRAKARHELDPASDPAGLAVLASGTLQTLAVRARAGVPRKTLERVMRHAVGVLCGGRQSRNRQSRAPGDADRARA